jgi:hypothetical protein
MGRWAVSQCPLRVKSEAGVYAGRADMIFGEDTQSGQSAVERRALRYHLVGLHVIVMSHFCTCRSTVETLWFNRLR